MEALKEQLNNQPFIFNKDYKSTNSIVSIQFKVIKNETYNVSKALKKELNNSANIFRSQWNNIKSYSCN
ncbi:hypothetical protein [Candidatus Marithrix sp. Canyon 246]|uniref:hypothetical protein n=1 Tax=Candidatus Marithrix sp. Canyon 246 TaxID=1827136 RepID=UPI000849FC62|nr:hypothetical protein [Candidatus Marithrix sp. Canyon 246]